MSQIDSPTRATTYDVAAATGLSQPTVSRILSGKGDRFRAGTREKVLAAARELEYLPHAGARSIRTGRHGAFALLLSTERQRSLLSQGMLGGIHEVIERMGLRLIVSPVDDRRLTSEDEMPRVLRELAADGLLINYNADVPPKMTELIVRHRVPSVWINRRLEHDAVFPDDLAAGFDATNRLLTAGHRRILFLDFTHKNRDAWLHYSITDRFAGYERAMTDAGLPAVLFGKATYRDEHTMVPALRELLRGPDGPTAFVAYGPHEARGVVAATYAAGKDPHRDVGLIAFAELWQSDLGVDLAYMRLPEHRIGVESVAMLRRKRDELRAPCPSVAVPFTAIQGRTCGEMP